MKERKDYLDAPKIIKSESAAGGKKRVWVEVADNEAIMLKVDSNAKQADIDAEAEKLLARLKETRAKEYELEALREQVAALEQELGQ